MAAKKKATFDVSLEALLDAGAHFGHQVKRWNPKMEPYIYAARDGVHIFDLAKTREALLEALQALKDVSSQGGTIIFVGTKRQARDLVRDAASKVGMPHVTARWLGGTLTNFEQMQRSIKKLQELKDGRENGKFADYTKRERVLIDKEISRMERIFGGITELREKPDMLFVVDTKREHIAVAEAQRVGIPVVGIVDTNADPMQADFPIPANDDAVKSISFILDAAVSAIEEGLKANKSN